MAILLHHKLDPASRLARLMFAEYGQSVDLEEASPWKRDERLAAVNPAASIPVIEEQGQPPVIGMLAVIHHIEEQFGALAAGSLVPHERPARAEMWRLFEWVMVKFNDEVTRYLLEEKIGKRETKSGAPDPSALRAAKANLSEHMHYFAYLLATRRWLGGEQMTLADFALAAHLSAIDYLGDINWEQTGETKDWYARIKSRPAFRPLLGDRVVGMPASACYADLDF